MYEYEKQIEELQEKISELRGFDDLSKPLADYAKKKGESKGSGDISLRTRRVLHGHFGKVYALDWGPHGNLVSAAQDGKLIVWTTIDGQKKNIIDLDSQWVMACGYSQYDHIVCSGGLDNSCSLYDVSQDGIITDDPTAKLQHHEGYLSDCEFLGRDRLLTSSGDANVILWDIKTNAPLHVFSDHESDVMSVTASQNHSIFVSGSCDATARLWDIRTKDLIRVFPGHESDVNSVAMFPDGQAFVSGSDDATVRLFDLRANRELNSYHDGHRNGATSVDVTNSGRYIIAGYDDRRITLWNTMTAEVSWVDTTAHESRVVGVAVSANGQGIATGSWDTYLKVWTK